MGTCTPGSVQSASSIALSPPAGQRSLLHVTANRSTRRLTVRLIPLPAAIHSSGAMWGGAEDENLFVRGTDVLDMVPCSTMGIPIRGCHLCSTRRLVSEIARHRHPTVIMSGPMHDEWMRGGRCPRLAMRHGSRCDMRGGRGATRWLGKASPPIPLEHQVRPQSQDALGGRESDVSPWSGWGHVWRNWSTG